MEQKHYGYDHWSQIDDHEKAISAYLKNARGNYQIWRDLIIYEKLLPHNLTDCKILDYGCGIGYHSIILAKRGAKVTGLDLSTEAIATAQYLSSKKGTSKKCTFLTLEDAFEILFKKTEQISYDLLFLKDIIEHIPNIDEIMHNLTKIIKNDGLALVTTPGSWSLSHFFEVLYHRYYLGDCFYVGGGDPTHIRMFSPVSLSRFMEKYGFKLIKWHAIGLIPKDIICKATAFKFRKDFNNINKLDYKIGEYFPINRLGAGMLTLWKYNK